MGVKCKPERNWEVYRSKKYVNFKLLPMRRTHLLILAALVVSSVFTSCKKKGCTDPTAMNYNSEAEKEDESCVYSATKDLSVNITGLPDLGPNYKYETWIAYNNMAISLGTFDVDATGTMSTSTFTGNRIDIESATVMVISIEPFPDANPTPSNVKILGGNFDVNNGSSANLSISYVAAVGDDLSTSAGDFVIDSPTTTSTSDDLSGVWFFNPGTANPQMTLPSLSSGWVYEGWAVIGGVPMSTGKFTDPNISDNSALYSGSEVAPNYPGEDFVQNAPAGSTFPTDLSGQSIFVTVEPATDNSPEPFVLRPLVGTVPTSASPMTPYTLSNNAAATSPSGTATR